MAMTPASYLQQLLALLPRGAAWPLKQTSKLTALMQPQADELALVDQACDRLMVELDAGSATELLPEWEAVTGLPGTCQPLTNNFTDRRKAAKAKLRERGGQSIPYFVAIAESLGYYIEIEETKPFAIGASIGEKLWGGLRVIPLTIGQTIGPLATFDVQAPFVWYVHALKSTVRTFAIGSVVGDPLAAWGNALLECVISKDAPAHTRVLFIYDIIKVPQNNFYLRAGDGAGAALHTYSGPYTYQRSL